VLSFPLFDFNDDFQPAVPIDLGDIFICFPVAKTQAKSLNVSLENELIHLFVHGFLHLLGFDHERSSKDERIMLKWEDHLIKKIHQKWK
jgi:probable rRNA maturation factor